MKSECICTVVGDFMGPDSDCPVHGVLEDRFFKFTIVVWGTGKTMEEAFRVAIDDAKADGLREEDIVEELSRIAKNR